MAFVDPVTTTLPMFGNSGVLMSDGDVMKHLKQLNRSKGDDFINLMTNFGKEAPPVRQMHFGDFPPAQSLAPLEPPKVVMSIEGDASRRATNAAWLTLAAAVIVLLLYLAYAALSDSAPFHKRFWPPGGRRLPPPIDECS